MRDLLIVEVIQRIKYKLDDLAGLALIHGLIFMNYNILSQVGIIVILTHQMADALLLVYEQIVAFEYADVI